MEKATLGQEILALIEDHTSRSKIAQLRDVFDEIETAMAAGVKRIEILKALEKKGIRMTLATFETSLQRIRKNRPSDQKRTISENEVTPQKEKVISAYAVKESTSDPRTVDTILSSTPDLAALTKHAPKGNQ